MFSPNSWLRFKRFVKRNEIVFYSLGLLTFSHFVWWEIQQIKSFVPKSERVNHLGPFRVPYLDELDFFKKKVQEPTEEK